MSTTATLITFAAPNFRGDPSYHRARVLGQRFGTSPKYFKPQWLVKVFSITKAKELEFAYDEMSEVFRDTLRFNEG